MQSSLFSKTLFESQCVPRDKFEQASLDSFLRTITVLSRSGMELRELGRPAPQPAAVSTPEGSAR